MSEYDGELPEPLRVEDKTTHSWLEEINANLIDINTKLDNDAFERKRYIAEIVFSLKWLSGLATGAFFFFLISLLASYAKMAEDFELEQADEPEIHFPSKASSSGKHDTR